MSVGVCILAGGLSSRMGQDKAIMVIPSEEKTLLEQVSITLGSFEEKMISVREKYYELPGYKQVVDLVDRIGPLGGIYSALSTCDSDALLIVACDMPFFSSECAEQLVSKYKKETCDILLCESEKGIEPLAGIYGKSCLPQIEKKIHNRDYRIRSLFEECQVATMKVDGTSLVTNINTTSDWELMCRLYKKES